MGELNELFNPSLCPLVHSLLMKVFGILSTGTGLVVNSPYSFFFSLSSSCRLVSASAAVVFLQRISFQRIE